MKCALPFRMHGRQPFPHSNMEELPVIRQESPSKARDAFARQYEFASVLEEILLLISQTGGLPNSRVYSRLDYETIRVSDSQSCTVQNQNRASLSCRLL